MHLGTYPMEKIKRVDRPTTLITDAVQRVPKRANFFIRGDFGDFGEKHRFERTRFIRKAPLGDAMRDLHQQHIPLHKGEPAPHVAPLTDDPAEMAKHIKSVCYFLDADIVGICEMPEYAWYSHQLDGTAIEPKHKYAIVIVIDQGWDTLEGSSGDDWISGCESYRAYLKGSTIAVTAANYIRRLGYPAQAHTNADGDVLQIPLILLAGLGEMSRIGELVLNPFLGPRFKTAVITTDLPLEVDKPIDFGLQDFCAKCQKCARECPVQAIPHGEKVLYNGYEIWKPDVGRCVGYRVKNPGGSACGRCMKMCPFNKEGIMVHRIALWAAIKWPFTRRLLVWLDDVLEYGRRNPIKKWWLDIETVDGRVVKAQRINARDLSVGKKIPTDNAGLAIYPPAVLPKPDERGPVPIDRAQGQRAREQAERDLAALKKGANTRP
ncbi:MAG: reductive dehalogenase [Acidobacteria bacterium]|nr:reductive dehalogenase [Acidobacteriota bacterium]